MGEVRVKRHCYTGFDLLDRFYLTNQSVRVHIGQRVLNKSEPILARFPEFGFIKLIMELTDFIGQE